MVTTHTHPHTTPTMPFPLMKERKWQGVVCVLCVCECLRAIRKAKKIDHTSKLSAITIRFKHTYTHPCTPPHLSTPRIKKEVRRKRDKRRKKGQREGEDRAHTHTNAHVLLHTLRWSRSVSCLCVCVCVLQKP
jgi:hypothetical protein